MNPFANSAWPGVPFGTISPQLARASLAKHSTAPEASLDLEPIGVIVLERGCATGHAEMSQINALPCFDSRRYWCLRSAYQVSIWAGNSRGKIAFGLQDVLEGVVAEGQPVLRVGLRLGRHGRFRRGYL